MLFKGVLKPVITNSFFLYISQFVDYLLALFFLTFISRTIGTEEFGKVALAQSFGIFLVLFMEFGFSLMATRQVAKNKNNINELKFFIGQITSFKLLLVPVAVLITVALILAVPIFRSNPIYLIIVSVEAIFYGLNPSWYFRGIEKVKKIIFSKIVFRFFALVMIITNVKSPQDAWFVLASFCITSGFICFYLNIQMFKDIGKIELSNPLTLKSIFNKSKYSFFITIIPVIYQNIVTIIMSLFLSPIQLGLYFGINRIYRAFNTLFSPISDAFYPRLNSVYSEDPSHAKKILIIFLCAMVFIGVVFLITIQTFAIDIIKFLVGESYLPASDVLKLFGFVLPLTAISNVLGRQWLLVCNKDSFYAIAQLISASLALTSFIYISTGLGMKSIPVSLIIYEVSAIFIILTKISLKRS